MQNKSAAGEGIDSVGQLVLIAEKQGFIPRYYVDSPKDKVDQIITDLQYYTRNLVTEELNLGSMIEDAVAANMRDQEKEETLVVEDSKKEDEVVIDEYEEPTPITEEEYLDYLERQAQLREQDMENGS